jgi:hypothetical protein
LVSALNRLEKRVSILLLRYICQHNIETKVNIFSYKLLDYLIENNIELNNHKLDYVIE